MVLFLFLFVVFFPQCVLELFDPLFLILSQSCFHLRINLLLYIFYLMSNTGCEHVLLDRDTVSCGAVLMQYFMDKWQWYHFYCHLLEDDSVMLFTAGDTGFHDFVQSNIYNTTFLHRAISAMVEEQAADRVCFLINSLFYSTYSENTLEKHRDKQCDCMWVISVTPLYCMSFHLLDTSVIAAPHSYTQSMQYFHSTGAT